MSERIVDKRSPKNNENEKRAELDALSERAGNQRWRNDGKHHLIDHKSSVRNSSGIVGIRLGPDPAQAKPLQATEPSAADVRRKCQAVAPQGPLDGDDGDNNKAMHDGA